ncbi:hypothetical protein KM043_004173 [Ampulex compressa]|nr:hypothetical protein KM043_004173 [Ampulex compressa]
MATSDFEIDEQVTVRESAEFRHANQELLEALEDRDSRGDCSAESTDEALKPGLRDRDRSSEGRSSGNDSEDHGVRRESRSSFLVPRDSLDDDSPLSNRESNSVPRGSIERQKSIRKPTESNAARNVANDLKNERGGAEERIPKNGKICESRTDRSLGNPEDKADYTRQIAVMDEGEEIEGASTGIQNRTNNVASSCKPVIHKIVSSGKYSSSAEPNTRIGKFEGDSPPRVKSSPPRVSSRNHADPVIDNTSGVYLDRVPRGSQRPAPCKIHDSPKDSFQSPVKKRDGSPGRKTGRSAGRSAAEGAKSLNGGRQGCPRKCENCGESHFSYDRYAYLGKYSGYLERDAGLQEEKEAPKDTRARGAGTPSLYRSRSLPRLSMHDSGVACSGNEQTALPGRAHSSRQLVADLKQLLTLKQHYYPEGGWGWVVLLVGVLVQVLSHGMHGASGVFLQQVATRFGPHVHLESASAQRHCGEDGKIDRLPLAAGLMKAKSTDGILCWSKNTGKKHDV